MAAPVSVGGAAVGRAGRGDARPRSRCRTALEQRLCDFADLVAQALANADAYEKLAASRARVVEVGDAERRRLERNLHDGAQQRLVSVALELQHGRREAREATRRPPASSVGRAGAISPPGLEELRELARGIHPAVLTERGLGPALDALLTRAPVPVEIVELPEERLPAPVEAAAYYVVAEAITNVGKYAHASHATVGIRRSNGARHGDRRRRRRRRRRPRARLRPARPRGRVEALNGRLDVDSPPRGGTRITAEIPCA